MGSALFAVHVLSAGSKTYTAPIGLSVLVSRPAITYHLPPTTVPMISPIGSGRGFAIPQPSSACRDKPGKNACKREGNGKQSESSYVSAIHGVTRARLKV